MYVKKVEVKRKIDEANDRIGRRNGYQSIDSSCSRSSSSNNSIKLGYIVAKSYKAGFLNPLNK